MCAIIKDEIGSEFTGKKPENIKVVPQASHLRRRIRVEAEGAVRDLSRHKPMARTDLERIGAELLACVGLDLSHLGFAMVEVSNAFWRSQFASVPFSRRLVLLPHCLRDRGACQGRYEGFGMICAECGACLLCQLKREAEKLGYKVLIAEGTPAVVHYVLGGSADAVLGVACLDSLEKAFSRILEMGIPHAAVPLLVDGCVDTRVEPDVVHRWIHLHSGPAAVRTRSFVPLLRAAEKLFSDGQLEALIAPFMKPCERDNYYERSDPIARTGKIALDWLRDGGKRFRPFVALASYAVLTHGDSILDPDGQLAKEIPDSVKRVAIAIEALHKASLVHDDIEDNDLFRYGHATLHRRYGSPMAINVGDYLVGLGYRLVASAADDLGAPCVTDIINHLSEAHLKLCRGQGADLMLQGLGSDKLSARGIQTIYALKTAPAFEAALIAGLKTASASAGVQVPEIDCIRRLCRYMGVAYQVLNDLKDLVQENGRDLLSSRPTILRALATATGEKAARALEEISTSGWEEETKVEKLRELYEKEGVFEQAEALVEKYRKRARAEVEKIAQPPLRDMMYFILETVL